MQEFSLCRLYNQADRHPEDDMSGDQMTDANSTRPS
jgi:hypothetical protein